MRKSMTFNGIRKPWLYLLEGRQKSPFPPVRNNLIRVTGMAGAHVSSKETDVVYIQQPIGFIADTDAEFLERKDELAKWLNTNKAVSLQFDDEPGRTYYAEIDGTIEDFSRFANQRRGIITFLCADPYGYGHEKTLHFPSDQVVVNNEGTAEADPIFELTATQKTTFAMISNEDDEYMLIGQPADDDIQAVDTETSVLYEDGSTINEWNQTQEKEMLAHDNHVDSLDGEMGADEAGISVVDYGTSKNHQRGSAIFKEIIYPIQDFKIETTFDIISNRKEENFRMVIYMLDENMNNIGHIGLIDNSRLYKRRAPISQLGIHQQGPRLLGGTDYQMDNADDVTLFYLRFKREGNQISAYASHIHNFKHETTWEGTYTDVGNQYLGKLKYITLFIGSYQDRITPIRLRISNVEIFELTTVEEDQTPYILNVGDVVTFDHKNDDILVNGEPRKDLKNFGASFFTLKKGENQLLVTPEDSFETQVKFREKHY